MKSIITIIISATLLSLFTSCLKDDAVYEYNHEIEYHTWNFTDTIDFEFEIQDTISFHDFYFNIRNTANYEWANLHVFYRLYFPNGESQTDSAEFLLADPLGKWYGNSASGGLIDNSILFSRKKKFPIKGSYRFSIIHGMRENPLPEITHVGFKIKKSQL